MSNKVFAFLVLNFFFLVIPLRVYADGDFDISTNARYIVSQNGNANVSQSISIRNKTEYTYTPSYTISTGIRDIRNLKVFDNSTSLQTKLSDTKDGGKSIEIDFDRRVVGFGKVNEFTVSFDTSEIAKNIGSIWEISIPGLANPESYSAYSVTLSVPSSFGSASISKPAKNLPEAPPYVFSKGEIGKSGILITFGKEQVYKLSLKYAISNTRIYPVKTEIALPPNTSYQDVRLNSLIPAPENVYRDEDGNWLAVYNLNPHEIKNIRAEIVAKTYSNPTFDIGKPKRSLGAAEFWEVGNSQIKEIAEELKTPQAIYEYVVNKLSYAYDKVGKTNDRLGALGSLARPKYAVCLEFTDLFVTLARAAGIPARAVEGYAYTGNSKLRPLSLVADVLHAWPEYYDETQKTWVMVDPTWGVTTGGMDYFSSFDFNHIAFVVNGQSSTYPIPAGGYKLTEINSKDVNVVFATSSEFTDQINADINANFPSYALSGISVAGNVVIENKGNMPILGKRVIVESDFLPRSQEYYIEEVLPYGKKVINISFPKTQFLTNKAYHVRILLDGAVLTKTVNVGVFPDGFLIIIGGLIICGSIIVAIASHKTWSIYFQKRKK